MESSRDSVHFDGAVLFEYRRDPFADRAAHCGATFNSATVPLGLLFASKTCGFRCVLFLLHKLLTMSIDHFRDLAELGQKPIEIRYL
jgi:hypothetical protein